MRLSHTFFQLLLVVLFGASLPAQARVEIDFGQQVQRPSGFAQVVSITAVETPEVEAGGVVTTVVGSRNVGEFANAFCGLAAWDDWADPNYLDRLLISPDVKPQNLLYKKQ